MTKKRDLILAIDSGTQNVKAAVFDRAGRVLALSRLAHEPDSAPRPRWVEHDPGDYWDKMCRATGEALSALGQDIGRVGAVGLTSQRGTTIPVDAGGNVLRPAIVYLDNRVTEELPPVEGLWGLFFAAIGRKKAIEYVRSHSRFLWIKTHQPEIYSRTRTFFQVASFLNFRLTGSVNESIGMMVGMFPLDYKKLAYYPQRGIHDVFGVSPDRLPELVRPLSVTGHITREASKKTLIPEGLPVIVGGGDVQAGAVGMGVTEQDTAALILGTTIDFDIPTRRFINDKKLRFLCWPAAIPDAYILESGVGGGFITVTWFTNELAHYEKEAALREGVSPEELLDAAVKDIPAGSPGSHGAALLDAAVPSRGRPRGDRGPDDGPQPGAHLPRHPGRLRLRDPGGIRGHGPKDRGPHQGGPRIGRRRQERRDPLDHCRRPRGTGAEDGGRRVLGPGGGPLRGRGLRDVFEPPGGG